MARDNDVGNTEPRDEENAEPAVAVAEQPPKRRRQSHRPAPPPPQPREGGLTNRERGSAFAAAVVFLLILLYIGARAEPIASEQQFIILRVVVAVAAAGFFGFVSGSLRARINNAGARVSIRAGGAAAIFVIVFLLNPPKVVNNVVHPPVIPPPPPPIPIPCATCAPSDALDVDAASQIPLDAHSADAQPIPPPPPPRPTCPGGAPRINGRCERCKFDIKTDAAGTSAKMVPGGGGGLQRHVMLSFTCPMRAGRRIRVQARGDVSVDTEDQVNYGSWPRWLEMNLRTTGTSQTDCATGQKPTYDIQIPRNHRVAMCGEWISNDDVTAFVEIKRCKQGDARTTCILQDNWVIEFATMP